MEKLNIFFKIFRFNPNSRKYKNNSLFQLLFKTSVHLILLLTFIFILGCGKKSGSDVNFTKLRKKYFEIAYTKGKENYKLAALYSSFSKEHPKYDLVKTFRFFEYSSEFFNIAKDTLEETAPPELYFMLGTSYNKLMMWDESIENLLIAKAEYEKSDTIAIEYWKTLYNLGRSLIEHPKRDRIAGEARTCMESILMQDSPVISLMKESDLVIFANLQRQAYDTLEKLDEKK